jgi:integrase/recombinase XerD
MSAVKKIIKKDYFDEKLKNITKTRDRILFTMLWETGARISELLSIRKIHVDFKDNTVRIKHLKRKVEGAERIVPISENLKILIKAFTEKFKDSDYLFNIERKQAYNLSTAYFGKECTPRQFRHSVAIDLVNSQVDIEAVRRHLGHSRLDVTQKYLDYDFETMKQSLAKRKLSPS